MFRTIKNYVPLKYAVPAAWSLLFLAGCGIKPVTTNNTHGATPSNGKPPLQSSEREALGPAVNQSEQQGPSGSLALLMPLGMPAKINQIRLSLARKTPELENLYSTQQQIEKGITEIQEKLNRAELRLANPPGVTHLACLDPVNGVCSLQPFDVGILDSPESIRQSLERARELAAEIDAALDTQVTSQAKTDPKGQLTFQLSVDTPKLERFDLAPGEYFLLVEVLDSTTGKIYQKGRTRVDIVAGKIAEANVKLVTVNQQDGGLVVNLGGSGFSMDGQSITCPVPTPASVCPAMAVTLSHSDQAWQYACQAQGHQLVSCVSNRCQTPIPSNGTQLCSGDVNMVSTLLASPLIR